MKQGADIMYDNEIAALSVIGEDGIEYSYYVVCRFTVGERDYIALAPQDRNDNKIELYRCADHGEGNLQLSNITSDFELDDVKRDYIKIIENEQAGLLGQDNAIDDVITIIDSDGAERVCEVITVFKYERLDCIALMPLGCHDSSEIELFAYHVNEDAELSIEEIPEIVFDRVQEYFIGLAENNDG